MPAELNVSTKWQNVIILAGTTASCAKSQVYHSGIKVFGCLPRGIKSLSCDVRKFKLALKRFLLKGSFYIIQDYFDWDILSNPSLGNLAIINDCWYSCFNNYIIYLSFVFFSLLKFVCEYTYFLRLMVLPEQGSWLFQNVVFLWRICSNGENPFACCCHLWKYCLW